MASACELLQQQDTSSSTEKPLSACNPMYEEIYVDDERKYVYCLVSKAACTSWKRTLLVLTGMTLKSSSLSFTVTTSADVDLHESETKGVHETSVLNRRSL